MLAGLIILIIIVIILGFCISSSGTGTYEEYVDPVEKSKAESRIRDLKKAQEIIDICAEMSKDERFQRLMQDVKNEIRINNNEIECIYFSSSILKICLQVSKDRWATIPRKVIEIDTWKYNLRLPSREDQAAFLYWLLQLYPFMTYHCATGIRESYQEHETNDIIKAFNHYDRDGDSCEASTIIYKKGIL